MDKKGSARRSNYIFEYRIAVLGGASVGKTSLIKRFTEDGYTEKHIPTIEDHFQHVVHINGSTCVCLLMDTSGSFEFPAMKSWSISKANAFVVVYSVMDKKSFDRAKLLVNDIKSVKGDGADIKIVLIGNKMEEEGKRKVPKETGEAFAKEISCDGITCELIETSAKEDEKVTDAFHCLLKMFLLEHAVDEENNEIGTEKRSGSFSRTLSLRKSHKNRKAKSREKHANKQTILRKSDENLLDIEKPTPRPRSQSLDSENIFSNSSSDSDGSRPSSPIEVLNNNTVPRDFKPFKRQSSAKELLRKTTSACKEKLDQAKRKLTHKLSKDNNNTQASIEILD